MVNGHMCAGVMEETLMLRVGRDGWADAMAQDHARVMDFTGRPSKNMVYVDPEGFEGENQLRDWLSRALRFVKSMPPKPS